MARNTQQKNSKNENRFGKKLKNSDLRDLEKLNEKEKKKYFDLKPTLATRQCSMASIESISICFLN